MSVAQARVSGVWVDIDLAGAVRVGGAWVSFGPEEPAGYEAIAWSDEPSLTNADDGTTYGMGIKFHLDTPKLCYGIRWRVPDSLTNSPSGGYSASLWNGINEQRIVRKVFTPVAGGYQDILFDSPVSLDDTPQEYVASVVTRHYVFRAASPPGDVWEVTSPSGNVDGFKGMLDLSGTDIYPASSFNSWFYVSPLIGV